MSEPYTIEEHQHRLAAWAAGRAASVKGCRFKVHKAKAILEAAGFDAAFFKPTALPSLARIDTTHRTWRKAVIRAAKQQGLMVTHGVAAKLINCYLKVRFVCGGHHEDERVQALHPPIDDVLLKHLAELDVGGLSVEWKRARKIRWSKFDSDQYEKVISLIKKSLPDRALWKIEEHWKGHR